MMVVVLTIRVIVTVKQKLSKYYVNGRKGNTCWLSHEQSHWTETVN